jgi:Predicted pPIWI-associating nuclease
MSWRHPRLDDSTVAALFENQRYFQQLFERSTVHADFERFTQSARQAADAMREPYREILESTRGIFGPLAALQSRPEQLRELFGNLHPAWQLRLDKLAGVDQFRSFEGILGTHAAAVDEISTAAATLFDRSDAARLEQTLGAGSRVQSAIAESIRGLTSDYGDLVRSASTPRELTALPPLVTEAPATEYFLAGELYYSVAAAEPLPEESEDLVADVHRSIEELPPVDELLERLDPALLVPLQGARARLRSSEPDRERQLSVSIRELLDHLFRTISPDDKVQKWTKDPKHFHSGKPTREARLLFTESSINHGRLAKFVRADVRAAIAFFDATEGGTHELSSKLTDRQLRAMVLRAEGLARFLADLSLSGDS